MAGSCQLPDGPESTAREGQVVEAYAANPYSAVPRGLRSAPVPRFRWSAHCWTGSLPKTTPDGDCPVRAQPIREAVLRKGIRLGGTNATTVRFNRLWQFSSCMKIYLQRSCILARNVYNVN